MTLMDFELWYIEPAKKSSGCGLINTVWRSAGVVSLWLGLMRCAGLYQGSRPVAWFLEVPATAPWNDIKT